MRYLLLTLILGLAIACNKPVKGKNGETYKNAVQYNDYIVGRQTKLMKNIMDFGKMTESDLDSAEQLLKKYVTETEKMIHDIQGMPSYKGDSSLREAAIGSFRFYKRVFEEDYMDLLNIRKKNEDITEADMGEMDRIVEKISKEEEKFDKAFHNAQRQFADKNNMKLRENEMQKEIDKIDQ
jgi:hypothetical protein